MSTFFDLPLLSSLQQTLSEQQILCPTEIQAKTLPPQLEGRSVLGVSETGSGKTLAYALPMLHRLKSLELEGKAVSAPSRPRGLVLVPTRELGDQVSKVFKSLTHATRVRVRTALGGSAKQVARQNVKGSFEILVATPGRLAQLLERGTLKLSDVRTLVFDEADHTLDASFLPVATTILASCPKGVQLVMFAATAPGSLTAAAKRLCPSGLVRVQTKGSHRPVASLTTIFRKVEKRKRLQVLREVIRENEVSTILFANTREQCDTVAEWLDQCRIAYVSYHGEMDRAERRKTLKRFREGDVRLLLTTDLGGRGLDIARVERVINAYLPKELSHYLHRAGRTARAGRPGVVVNLVTQRDQLLMNKLERRERKRGS